MSIRLSRYQYHHSHPKMLYEKGKEYTRAYYECKMADNPLKEAVRSGIKELVKTFLFYSKEETRFFLNDQEVLNQNFNRDQHSSLPAFHIAIGDKRDDIADLMLLYGYDINAQNTFGSTALHLCGEDNLLDQAAFLIYNRARVNIKDLQERSPLHIAALFNNARVCSLLLENGAEVDARSHLGNTALKLAANEHNLEALDVLLDHGADVHIHDCFQIAAAEGKEEIIKLMLRKAKNLKINKKDVFGSNALHSALVFGHINIAKLLLAHGAEFSDDIRDSLNHPLLKELSLQEILSYYRNPFCFCRRDRVALFLFYYNLTYLFAMKTRNLISSNLSNAKKNFRRIAHTHKVSLIATLALSMFAFLGAYIATRRNTLVT